MSSKARKASATKTDLPPMPWYLRPVALLLRLPRFGRLLLAALPALAVAIVTQPIVDQIYLNNFFSERTVVLPSLIIAGLALGTYFIGWVIYVGTPGQTPTANRRVLAYLLMSLIVIVIAGLSAASLMSSGADLMN